MTHIKVDSKLSESGLSAPEVSTPDDLGAIEGRGFDSNRFHPLVSWRSIVGGLLVSFLCFAILASIGMALGGLTVSQGSISGMGLASGFWMLLSTAAALFTGSYFAARISKFSSDRVGSAQGIIIASIFFGFATLQTFATYQAIAQGSVLESTDLRAGGWSLFALLVIGSIAAASGGAMGSRQNARKPLSREIYASRSEMEPAHV